MHFRKHVRWLAVSGHLAVSIALLVPAPAGAQATDPSLPGRFGRMFRSLPPFAPPSPQVRAALRELGKKGGILDANDAVAAGPVALIVDPALSANNRNNPTHTAGTTFMGQFLDHDMTLDSLSTLNRPTNPNTVPNVRSPIFDLDSVYGAGPSGSPRLYQTGDTAKFRVESGGLFEDLPRNPANQVAIIADPRNDENLMIAGLHAAFLLFHNNAVDLLRSQNPSLTAADAFTQARRLTTLHYQWLILHEFLPLFVGQDVVDDVLTGGRRFYVPSAEPFIPVEFQMAYRIGHSMVRPSYRANLAGDDGAPFFGLIFDPAGEGSPDPVDLRGFARAPRRFIGWQTFFDFGDGEVRPNKRIDTKLSTPLFNLPASTIAGDPDPVSLAQRNLLRHLTWSLPSGQDIARAIGAEVLDPSVLADAGAIRASFATSTPLWFYVLREAEVMQDGLRLGPVGARIVGEVFIGLLQLDPGSVLNVQPVFRPSVPTRTGDPTDFRMTDFLRFARVDPASRGQ
jgi:hypothetical protein